MSSPAHERLLKIHPLARPLPGFGVAATVDGNSGIEGTKDVAADPISSLRLEMKKAGYALLHYDDRPIHSYPYDAPWLADTEFGAVYERVRRNKIVDRPRCYSLFQISKQVRAVAGNILEVGMWRGGTTALLASAQRDKTVFGADTFAGVVKSQAWEHYRDGAHADTDRETVAAFFAELGLANVTILEGVFPDDTGAEVADQAFSLVHIDVDVYSSASDILDFVWPRLSTFGVVVLDDYGFVSACAGVHRLGAEGAEREDCLFIASPNGQAYLIKK